MNVDEYERLKAKVERLKTETHKAEGALEESTKRLQERFGCKSIAEAKKLLKKLSEESAELESQYKEALELFEKEWSEVL